MNFIKKHQKLLLGVLIGYVISRQFGARIEMQVRQATASFQPTGKAA